MLGINMGYAEEALAKLNLFCFEKNECIVFYRISITACLKTNPN